MLFFEKTPAIRSWSVDTDTSDNILSIETNKLSEDDIIQLVEKAGFKIMPIPSNWPHCCSDVGFNDVFVAYYQVDDLIS